MNRKENARGDLPPLLGGGRTPLMAWLVLCGLAQAASLAAAVWLTRAAIDGARAGEALTPFAVGLAGAGVATALARVGEKRLSERMGQLYVADLRAALLVAVAQMPGPALRSRPSGALVLRYTGDLASMRGWIARGLVRIVVAGVTMPALLAALALISAPLGLAVGAVLATGLAATWSVGPHLQRRHHRARSRRGALSVRMAERVIHPLTLRFASSLPRERRRLGRANAHVVEESVRRGTISAAIRAIPDAASGLALALVVAIGAGAVADGTLSVGGLVAAVAMVGLVTRPLREIAGVEDRRRAFIAARDRVLPILRDGAGGGVAALAGPPGIRLDGVVVGPPGSLLDIMVPAGAGVCLVGPAESGKSRLIDAIAGLGPVEAGRVRLITEAGEVEPEAAGAGGSVGYVSHRIPPFRGRVRTLLRLRDGGLEDAACRAILRRAGAWEALDVRGGLDARIAEGGANLSGPVRMRLMLAVALAGDPPMLLVDEAEQMGRAGIAALAHIVAEGRRTCVVALTAPGPDHPIVRACAVRIDLGQKARAERSATPLRAVE